MGQTSLYTAHIAINQTKSNLIFHQLKYFIKHTLEQEDNVQLNNVITYNSHKATIDSPWSTVYQLSL